MAHEILLVLRWLWRSVQRQQRGEHRGEPPEAYRNNLRTLLGRARSV